MRNNLSLAITTLMTVVGLQLLLLPRSSTTAKIPQTTACTQAAVSGRWFGISLGRSQQRLDDPWAITTLETNTIPRPQGALDWLRGHTMGCEPAPSPIQTPASRP
ncbi:hypothetical protein [Limnothrix redekei]|uniref:Uncharacterized protein n=1 Tax=Limnothrix redekei LRLZ20PSL1 TaxID=3112953 RepID=A0ABW7C8T6_9CYAN